MPYYSTEPTAALLPFVERFLLVEQFIPEGQQVIQVLPSCTSQLAINLATANLKPEDKSALDRHFGTVTVGPFTRRHEYVLHGHIHSIVTYFTPVGLCAASC